MTRTGKSLPIRMRIQETSRQDTLLCMTLWGPGETCTVRYPDPGSPAHIHSEVPGSESHAQINLLILKWHHNSTLINCNANRLHTFDIIVSAKHFTRNIFRIKNSVEEIYPRN